MNPTSPAVSYLCNQTLASLTSPSLPVSSAEDVPQSPLNLPKCCWSRWKRDLQTRHLLPILDRRVQICSGPDQLLLMQALGSGGSPGHPRG